MDDKQLSSESQCRQKLPAADVRDSEAASALRAAESAGINIHSLSCVSIKFP